MLELQNISAAYRKGKENRIIENTDLQLAEGEILGIIGKNGSGKSTLVKAIINQIPRKEGVIYFKGNDISNKPTFRCIKDGIGYFPQGGRIFHNLSMRENLTFAGRHLSKKERGKKLNGLSDFIPDIK
ncbi:MAG: ATP-binding cassette domain-containing protein, partial [Bacteroidota bacterium]